jgi:hypothetical protein
MNTFIQYGLRATRTIYRFLFLNKNTWKQNFRTNTLPNQVGQAASDLIFDTLNKDAPCMVARIGASEMNCYANYIQVRLPWKERIWKYIKGENNFAFWDHRTISGMCDWSGYYPPTIQNLERYSRLLAKDTTHVDILGSWMKSEMLLTLELKTAKTVRLEDLEPYRHTNPWSRVLEGKRVLVIHPFEDSIRTQFAKRALLFPNSPVLPTFELLTLKSVQSITGNWQNTGFADWFEALDHMKKQIDMLDFDIAIIGCGAYGFHLAAHIKHLGKKAVHLGGATQLLFGIMGRRWESVEEIQQLVNQYWIRPNANETPKNHTILENGAYW